MKIAPFDDIRTEEWDAVCDNSEHAWLFHRSAWVALERDRFVRSNLSFAVLDRATPIAVQPLYLSDGTTGGAGLELLIHSGIHRHTGLAAMDGLDQGTYRTIRSEAMRWIVKLAADWNVDRIQLNSHNLAPINRGDRRQEIPFWVLDYGFQLGLNFARSGMLPSPAMTTCNADQILDLSDSDTELFSRLDETCRRAVRKARSQNLRFFVGSDEACIEDYYAVAVLSAKRTHEVLPPIDYYREIWKRFFRQNRCAFLFTQHGDTLVAALALLIDKGAASFLAGVSHPDFLPMRVNDFIHWTAIMWAKERGLALYRFGPIFPEVPVDWPIAKVSRFKGKFGSRSRMTIQGSYFRRPEKYLDSALMLVHERCEPRSTD